MKKTILTILASVVASVGAVIGVLNFVPVDWLSIPQRPSAGTTLTTINGSDTLSSSRSVINSNFSALNTGKFELSDWYATTSKPNLATVGTVTSGTWNASIVGVPYGGTGWGNIQAGSIPYGNGTGPIATTSAGTNGQFLQLVGGVPTWATSAIDTTVGYNWTGYHKFNAGLFANQASTTNSTSTTQAITGTPSAILKTNSIGSILAAVPSTDFAPEQLITATSTATTTASASCTNACSQTVYATSTPLFTIPAGAVTASTTISVRAGGTCTGISSSGGGSALCGAMLKTSTGQTLWSIGSGSGTSGNLSWAGSVTIVSYNDSSHQIAIDSGGSVGTTNINLGGATNLVMTAYGRVSSGPGASASLTSASLNGYTIVVNP